MARLAETLLPMIDDDTEHAIELATEVLNEFPGKYTEHWLAGMREKIGLRTVEENDLYLHIILGYLCSRAPSYLIFVKDPPFLYKWPR